MRSNSITRSSSPCLKPLPALGLSETATESEVLVAINSLKNDKQVALNAANTPDPAKFIPTAQHTALADENKQLKVELNAIKTKERDAEITQLVEGGVKEGKVVPASREYFVSMCPPKASRSSKSSSRQPLSSASPSTNPKESEAQLNAAGLTEAESRSARRPASALNSSSRRRSPDLPVAT